jgi:hypothetical protein
VWFRTVRLAVYRGQIEPKQAQFLAFATRWADRRGRITDVPAWINTYAAFVKRTERTAWNHLKPALDAGWIRCTQHAAPHVPANYELQIPVHLVPNDLPEDLTAALTLHQELPEPDGADVSYGHLSALVDEWETVQVLYGHEDASADPDESAEAGVPDGQQELHTSAGMPLTSEDVSSPTKFQTSPITRGSASPYWLSTSPQGEKIAAKNDEGTGRRRKRPVSAHEVSLARQVLAECEAAWCAQRGRSGGLTAAQVDAVVLAAALALRRTTPGHVRELVTVQVRSARDLAGVVAARLWTFVRAAPTHDERAAHLERVGPPVDEVGGRRAAAGAALEELQDRVAPSREQAVQCLAPKLAEQLAVGRAKQQASAEAEAARRARYPVRRLREPEPARAAPDPSRDDADRRARLAELEARALAQARADGRARRRDGHHDVG